MKRLSGRGGRLCGIAWFVLSTALTVARAAGDGVGATVPFTTYEAEAGTLAGGATVRSLVAPLTGPYSSPELEASGRAFVELKGTGQSVSFTNSTGQPLTACDLRFAIPDSAGGGGTTNTLDLYVDGVLRQTLTLSSAQSWLYEGDALHNGNWNDQSQVPSNGNPTHVFDDTHFLIAGAAVAPGSVIMLRQDTANTAAFYWIDLLDVEAAPVAITQTAGSLSVKASPFNARGDGLTDDTQAIRSCMAAAASQGKPVWIPPGRYRLTGPLYGTGITVEGAGVWYTTLYATHPSVTGPGYCILVLDSCTIRNVAVDSDATLGAGVNGEHLGYALLVSGSNWLVEKMWCQHTEAGAWASGNNGTVQNCRMLSTWGDGINLNNGDGSVPGNSLTAQNNFIRGSSDDGVAINSTGVTTPMTNAVVRNNTSIQPRWANGLRVAGGVNSVMSNNLVVDAGRFCGITVGIFGNAGSNLGGGTVANNLVIRGGGNCYGARFPALNLGVNPNDGPTINGPVQVSGNVLRQSLEKAVAVDAGNTFYVQGNTVDGLYPNSAAATSSAFSIDDDAAGTGVFNRNTVQNWPAGIPMFVNYATPRYEFGGVGNVGVTLAGVVSSPWSGQDIGTVGGVGADSYATGTFALVGSGTAFGGAADSGHLVSQTMTGDGEIRARVDAVENVGATSTAGVMMRESAAGGARNFYVAVVPGTGVVFQGRGTTGGATTVFASAGGVAVPCWVRLQRVGNVFTASYSPDGAAWNVLGTQSIALNGALSAGMATASGNAGTCSVLFAGTTAVPLGQVAVQAVYPLDGSATDASGNGNTGTANAVTYVAGVVGSQAAQFDGAGSYVRIPASITTNFSVSLWVKTTDPGGSGSQWWQGRGLVDGETGGLHADWGASVLNGRFAFGVGNPDTTITSAVAVNDGAWHHLAATRDNTSGTMQVYVDGVLSGSGTGPLGARTAPPALRVGSVQTGASGSFLNGAIDEVALYNGLLGRDQIVALTRAPTGLSATPGNGSVALTWNVPSAYATGYYVKRATVSGGPCTTVATTTLPACTDAGLTNGATYYYIVSALDSGVETPASSQLTAVPGVTFASWQQQYFTGAQLAQPQVSGPTGDANGDGVANLLAYAFNLSPWANATASLPTASIVNGQLTITYVRRKAQTDITYAVDVSGDLVTWNAGAAYTTQTSVTSIDGTTERAFVRDNAPAASARRFIRLRVSQ